MKKNMLAMAGLLLSISLVAQNQPSSQPGCFPFPKTISVNGSAEMEVIPDEIYVQV